MKTITDVIFAHIAKTNTIIANVFFVNANHAAPKIKQLNQENKKCFWEIL